MVMTTDRALLTPDEAAAILGISAGAVRQAVAAGQLPGSVLGTGRRRRYLIPALALERYLAGEWRGAEPKPRPASIPFVVRRKGA
jgi:excisionase family DNA binding protein